MHRQILVLVACVVPVRLVQAAPLPIALFPTGVGPAGMALAPGSPDTHYAFTEKAGAALVARENTVVVTDPPGGVNGWYAMNLGQSQWVGVAGASSPAASGTYTVATTFSLTNLNKKTATITFNCSVDNTHVSIFINNTATTATCASFINNQSSTVQANATTGEPFVDGVNTIFFKFTNAPSAPIDANPMGILVNNISGSAGCGNAMACPMGQQCNTASECVTPTVDSDADGILDTEECTEAQRTAMQCPDTDGDGDPDYKDTDSDNDTLPDAEECLPRDADNACMNFDGNLGTAGDTKPDYLDDDSDADGLLDKDEKGKDKDKDGISDVRDPASPLPITPLIGTDPNGNGAAVIDTDGDGIADSEESDDSDGNGILDKNEKTNRFLGGGGCALQAPNRLAFGQTWLWLAALAGFVVTKKRRRP